MAEVDDWRTVGIDDRRPVGTALPAPHDEWAEFRIKPAPPHDEWAEFRLTPTRDQIAAAHNATRDPRFMAAPPSTAADITKSAVVGGVRNAPIAFATAPTSLWDAGAHAIGNLVGYIAPDSLADVALQSSRHFVERNPQALRDLAAKIESPEFIAQHSYASDPEVARNFRRQAEALENDPVLRKEMARNLFRYGDVSDRLTAIGVPDYQPQTTAGRYTKTIAEFVPQALAGGGESTAANLIKGALVPGATSEAAGEATEGTPLETPARILGGIAGGGVAHVGQSGLNAVRMASAGRSAAQEVGNLVGNPDITGHAVRLMAKDVRNEGLTPDIARQRMEELGPEGLMLDAGRQQLSRAQGVATEMGPGQTRILNAVEGRTGDFGDATAQRIKATLNQEMGKSPDVVAMRDAVAKVVDQQAKPLYDSVMQAHPVVDVPADITSRPAVAAAMRDAPEVARNYGEKLSQPVTRTTLNAAGVPVTETVMQPAQPSLRYWDYTKKVLDKRIKGYYTGSDLSSADKADLGGLQAARRALVDHLDAVTGGAYEDARRVAAAKPQLTEALQDGRDALNTKLLPEELKEIHDNMSIPEQGMLRAGMRREVERIIDTARNDGAAARRILDTNQNREKIAAIFGQRAADAIDRRIGAETQFQTATHKIAQNSETAFRQSARKDTESPSVSEPPSATMLGYAMKGVNALRQQRANAGTERTRAAIGALSTTPGRQVPDLVRILAGYNQRAAANARPPISPLARTMASVLGADSVRREEEKANRAYRANSGLPVY